ncbi:terpenoid synthase [Thelephora ganbajun]|uniref:Terpenoid synthase n=1 Tax=Thelephora ganbajun TaxID=370292 RepID=A0ACB6Z551_THEGA|nr:terpenoid synthase [Thelephora ganbajun]
MYFLLPDLPRICPFPPSLNPCYGSVASESRAWIDSLGILSGRQQHHFAISFLELLAAHAYPYADREGYRTSCDYMNLTFILDDYSDDEGGRGARAVSDSFMNALKDPTRDDGTPFAKLAREFKERLNTTSTTARQRFIDTFDHYLDYTVREAENREHGTILNSKDLTELRRGNSGVDVAFSVTECILSIDLQPKVFDHPVLSTLRKLAGQIVFTINDIYSYNKEQASGHSANNFITVIKEERGVESQEAFDVAGQFFENDVQEFLRCKDLLPSWGPEVDEAVSRYVTGLECWVGGSLEWSLSGHRYFGDSVEEVRRTRRVALAERHA